MYFVLLQLLNTTINTHFPHVRHVVLLNSTKQSPRMATIKYGQGIKGLNRTGQAQKIISGWMVLRAESDTECLFESCCQDFFQQNVGLTNNGEIPE